MIWAVFKIMALRLLRDKGALVLAFVLPGFIYAIFAAIFSSASGGNLDIRVAMAVTTQAQSAQELSLKLQDQTDFTLSFDPQWSDVDVTERVRLGTEDVGLIIRGDLSGSAKLPIVLITEPSREIAASVLSGRIREMIAQHMPHIILDEQSSSIETIIGGYSPAQSDRLSDTRQRAQSETKVSRQQSLITTRSAFEGAGTPALKDASVAYYVGATAILFLLFSAMQGAGLTLEERGSGITQRLLMGPRGASAMVLGKFAFLTLQGTLQAFVILGVAALAFDVPVLSHLLALTLISIASAAVAASIALLVASISKSSVQMHTVSTFIVLLFSAIGGSMVPRFMMPDWLQSASNFTPNAWAIEGFYGVLARSDGALDIAIPLTILSVITVSCLALAALISHRFMRF